MNYFKQFLAIAIVFTAITCKTEAQKLTKPIKPNFQPNSQNSKCTTMEGLAQRLKTDAKYAAFHEKAVSIPSIPNQSQMSRIPCDGANTIRVPVAFHFDEGFACGDVNCVLPEVIEQLDALNLGFADNTGTPQQAICPQAYLDENGNDVASTGTCIEFYMPVPPAATGLDVCDLPITLGQFNGGLNGGGSGAGAAWAGILNIFITNNQCAGVADGIPGAANGDGVTVCQAVFGGVSGPSAACSLDTDGSYDLGITLVHEIGHYLGLYHTFQGGCGTQEPNPPGPFDVLDTPAHSTPTSGNPTGCSNSSCGGFVPTANFMDYTDDAGYSMFTEDQAQVLNYWANQLFGSNTLADADPTGSITTACGGVCQVICPTQVTTAYSDALDLCASLGTYDLPADFSNVVLDESISATFTWSTGSYISAGGLAVAGTTYTLPTPSSCAPITETLYLNTGCTDNSIQEIDAGTLVLTIYPDPTQFAPADLITFADGACDGPAYTITPGCESYVTVAQNGGPAFPVTSGAGTVDYDVSLNYPVECCCPTTADSETQSNTTSVAIPDDGGAGNPGCTTVTINSGDPITSVIVDLDIDHTWVGDLIITLTSPSGTVITLGDRPGVPAGANGCSGNDLSVTFDDASTNTATDFENTCANAPAISGAYQPVDPLSSFAGESAAGTWTLCVSDNAGADTGSITNFGLTVNTEVPCTDPVDCAFAGSANYNCATSCASVNLDILFDGFPGQTSWDITDASGTVVASGGTYTGQPGNSALNTSPACLPDGCYDLNFYDAINNGMCPFRSSATGVATFITPGTLVTPGSIVGTLSLVVVPGLCGSYTLTDPNGGVLVSGGGSFGASETNQFCLVGGVAPRLAANAQNVSKTINDFVFEIKPTVTSNFITVNYADEVNGQLRVIDLSGKALKEINLSINKVLNSLRIDVSAYNAGVYFVQLVTNEGEIQTKKFMKQ